MRVAIRSLLKSPGYTIVALLTLALGIGVNSSMFSVIDTLLFRTGPFPHPERLVQVTANPRPGEVREYSAIESRELRAQTTAFSALATIGRTSFAWSETGRPAEHIGGIRVSADFFATFGLQPMIGRAFTPEEYQSSAATVVVLSYRFWQERFAGDVGVLGRTLRLDGENVTVVGVMPPSFDYPMLWGWCSLWRPLVFSKDELTWRDLRIFQLIGRLKDDATLGQATAELEPVAVAQAKQNPESYSELHYRALPLNEALMDKLGRRISWMLLGLSGFVLLIACANLANLQLARTTRGMREVAIRAALGASRARLILQQLTESIVIAVAGGLLGLLLALALNRVLETYLLSSGSLGGVPITLNASVLIATMLVALGTGVTFGIVPAWIASRADVNTALKQQARGSTAGGQHRVRQLLIIGEVALALVLLGGAAILQRGFARMLDRRAGWDADRIVTGTLPVPENRFPTDPKRVVLFQQIERRLAAIPGVEHAAIATSLPLQSYNGDRQVLTEGQTPGDAARLPAAFHVMVSPDFFATLGITLVNGRTFPADLKTRDHAVVIVNEALARRLWPGRSAIGQRLGSMDSGKAYWAEVIGVARDVDTVASVADPATPYVVYKPLVQEPWSYVYLVVRAVPGIVRVDGLGAALRQAVAEVDPDLVVDGIGSVRQHVDRQQYNLRAAASLLSGFAILGLVLAAVGLYGVISHLVAQRTSEFGIRLALGAKPGDVLRLVLRHGLWLTAIGAVIGIAGAYGLGRFLASLLPRLATPDLLAITTMAGLLFLVAVVACWVPARRATKVDPLIALRAE